MSTIVLIGSGSALTVPCLNGKHIRIVSVQAVVTTPAALEQAVVSFIRSGQMLISAPFPELTVNVVALNAFIGAAAVGAEAGTTTNSDVSTALPDALFPFDVQVSVNSNDTMAVSSLIVTYQVVD